MPARILPPQPHLPPHRGTVACRLALVELVVHRGSEPPLHRHHDEDLLVFVLAGRLTYLVGGHPVAALPGSLVLIPRGAEHGYTVESGSARLLVVVSPAGAERYLAALHGAAAGEDVERLIALAARYGIEITGPPPDPGDRQPIR